MFHDRSGAAIDFAAAQGLYIAWDTKQTMRMGAVALSPCHDVGQRSGIVIITAIGNHDLSCQVTNLVECQADCGNGFLPSWRAVDLVVA